MAGIGAKGTREVMKQLDETIAAKPLGDLNRRLRAAFLAGAEEQSSRDNGRGLTEEELRRVLRHYPGDLPEE
jgi:hypothetical protein